MPARYIHCNTLQHCNTASQHTAIHCNTLQHTATCYMQNAGMPARYTYCNTLQHTATNWNTLQHTATQPKSTFIRIHRGNLRACPIHLRLIHKCDMTHWYVWHDSLICVTCGHATFFFVFFHMWTTYVTRPYVIWLIRVWDMTHSYTTWEVGGWGRDPKKCTGRDWGWGQVPFNETYAPSLSTIYDGA